MLKLINKELFISIKVNTFYIAKATWIRNVLRTFLGCAIFILSFFCSNFAAFTLYVFGSDFALAGRFTGALAGSETRVFESNSGVGIIVSRIANLLPVQEYNKSLIALRYFS